MKTKVINDTTGGLSLRDSELLDDNQFQVLKNFYYDQDKRLRTRKGIAQYFDDVPDAAVTIDACNATTGWSVSDDGANLLQGTAIRGTNSLEFDVDVSASGGDLATLTKSTITANITTTKGYLGLWLKVPTGFNTNLTAVKIRLGSDSSNYYEWTLGTLTENENVFIKLDYSDATTTGTPADAAITYFRWQATYGGAYLDQNNVLIDSIISYSATSLEPIQGYYFVYDTNNEQKITVAVAGTNMFHWNKTGWDQIDSGLTKFETAEGKTTHRTRWGFFAYNGSGTLEVGEGNGIDDYRTWNGTVITTHGAQPKCKYFVVVSDRIFSSGDPNAPIVTYYTGAAPANAQTLNTNDVDVGTEFDGDVNGLYFLGEIILAGKSGKTYYVDVDNTIAQPIDTQNGLFSNRVTSVVGNAILYQTKDGIDNLRQKEGTTGAQAIESNSYSSDLQERFALITDNQKNANCGFYDININNYYFSFDASNDNKPDTTFVFSSLVGQKNKGWSEYTYPAIYQYGIYIDDDNNEIPLICSANAGQIYQIETGFDDLGGAIEYEFITKDYHMGDPAIWKDWKAVDIFGLKNKGSEMTIEIIVDDDIVYTATLDDTYIEDVTEGVVAIGDEPIGDEAIGGGAATSSTSEIDLFRYRIRLGGDIFAAGRTLRIRGVGNTNPTVLTLDRFQITFDDNTYDIYPNCNYA
jgi:hypothetical protein